MSKNSKNNMVKTEIIIMLDISCLEAFKFYPSSNTIEEINIIIKATSFTTELKYFKLSTKGLFLIIIKEIII